MRHLACAGDPPASALARRGAGKDRSHAPERQGRGDAPDPSVDRRRPGPVRAVPAGAVDRRGIPTKRQILITTAFSANPASPVAPRGRTGTGSPPADLLSIRVAGLRYERGFRSGRRQHVRLPVRSRRAPSCAPVSLRLDDGRHHARHGVEDPLRARLVAPGQVARVRLGRAERQGPRSLRHPAVRSEDQAAARRLRRARSVPQDWSPDGNSLLAVEFLSNCRNLSLAGRRQDRRRRKR